jgi:hypothetical protein
MLMIVLAFVIPALLLSYFLFRQCDRKKLVSRAPFFFVVVVVLFLAGATGFPIAFPGPFGSALGHPVNSMYQYPVGPSGIQESETWWVARWANPIQWIMLGSVVVGMIWAVANVVKKRNRVLNALTLVAGLLWFGWSAYVSLTCFPFCF